MKKQLLLLAFLLSLGLTSKATPGDTTWVQAHTGKWLDYYNNFDTTVHFPDGTKTYRKIYMVFTLGKYACPGSPQYCSDWDYTVQVYLMKPPTDTMELGRLITPYGKGSRMPANWTGRYIFDVTDFYPVLKDDASIRIHYSGYSGGFTANIKFMMIEGTPERNVYGVSKLWGGSFPYGKPSDPISNYLTTKSRTAPANAQSAEMKLNITGHGSDTPDGCSEFCKKYYQIGVNGNQVVQRDIWRNNCALNWLYPQSGTWIFERGGWCPGDLVQTNSHVLTGVTGGSNYTVDMFMQAYSGSGAASYTIQSEVFYYGAMNRSIDGSIEDIIAPTNFEGHYRENPTSMNPRIKVRNTGSTAINSITFEYGVEGTGLITYKWNGTIAPREEKEIELYESWHVRNASTTSTNTFVVNIKKVNDVDDEDVTNNTMRSTFVGTPTLPTKFVIVLKTNGGTINGVSETSWKIYDLAGNVVAQRSNCAINTTYNDTVNLAPANYKLVVKDTGDYGGDGLSWWMYPNYPVNPGTGSFTMKPVTSAIPYATPAYFGGDFGGGFNYWFKVDWPTRVEEINSRVAGIRAYPNPAQNTVQVLFEGLDEVNGDIQLIDVTGKVLTTKHCTALSATLDLSAYANGVYSVVFTDAAGKEKMQTRLVIAR